MNKWGIKALLCATALQLSGCIFESDDHDSRPHVGTLTVRWTIDGLTDPGDCAAFGVDRMELALYTAFDEKIDEVNPVCEAFEVSVDLDEGRYSADATLVDSFDRSATETQVLDALDVYGDNELVVDIDFPLDSFL
jgi:hypothetical protein